MYQLEDWRAVTEALGPAGHRSGPTSLPTSLQEPILASEAGPLRVEGFGVRIQC